MKRNRVLVMIAAYNEEASITEVTERLINEYPQYDYVIIDDGSTDATGKICDENGYNVLHLPVNLGIGGAIQTGYRYAEENGYDIAVQLDGDGQHDPASIEALIKPILNDEADYVVGSRFVKGSGAGDEQFQSTAARRAGIVFLSGLILLLCGKRIHDVTSGFRAVNRWFIGNFAHNYPTDYPEPEAIMDAAMNRARILEVGATMHERTGGKSSITMGRGLYYMIKVTLDIVICRISYGLRRGYPLLEAKEKEERKERERLAKEGEA